MQELKLATLKLLDQFPSLLGNRIYHFLQKMIPGKSLKTRISETERTFHSIQQIAKTLDIDLFSKRAVEIGSGWLPILPYFLKYFGGVETIVSYDLNKHYSSREINKLNKEFNNRFGYTVEGEGSLFLPREIEYFSETNIITVDNLGADLMFSRFVLEHVHPDDLRKMHQKFKNSLTKGAYIFHFISPNDHRAYINQNLSLQDFLRFSNNEWEKEYTSFDYHNRWRLPQYISLFNELGYEIVYLDFKVPTKNTITYQKFKEVKLHPDFIEYSEEELLAGGITIVLKV